MYRQGDVWLKPMEIPPEAVLIKRKQDGFPHVKGIVLAAGEATGHHHVVRTRSARLYRTPTRQFLRVSRCGAEVTHEEHDPIALPPGDYLIGDQREYEPPESAMAAPRTRRVYD
jgi:hypothetical protein